jgi:hypothetical protein
MPWVIGYLLLGLIANYYCWHLSIDVRSEQFWYNVILWPSYVVPMLTEWFGLSQNWTSYLIMGAAELFVLIRLGATWALYFLIGGIIHVYYYSLPIRFYLGRFWLDVTLWPFVMLWDWPKAAAHLPEEALSGIGYVVGLVFILVIIAAIGRAYARRSRGEWW